jgi:hypothetical protein
MSIGLVVTVVPPGLVACSAAARISSAQPAATLLDPAAFEHRTADPTVINVHVP